MKLKTNVENIAKPASAKIIIGVLSGYISHSKLFFIATILTFRSFKKSIKIDLPQSFINSSGLVAWLYLRLQKKVSSEQAF